MDNNRIDSFFRPILYSAYYFFIRLHRKFKNWRVQKDNVYLFILSPPYCGSTMLSQLLSSSSDVSCNNYLATREGQLLPGVRDFMFLKNRWDESVKYPWKKVLKVWMKYWDVSKKVLLDKSIPNIMRVEEIVEVFNPIRFICFVRNPYAQVEGIMRRNNQDPRSAAEFAVRCLQYQSINKARKDTLFFSYEDLCDNPNKVVGMILDFLPEVECLNTSMNFTSHNFKSKKPMKMVNLNKEKISRINNADLAIINSVFVKYIDLFDVFNYKIINNE